MADINSILSFSPSKYQEEIFDFILHGNGNALITAYAGCGKTSTCVEAMKLIDKRNKVIFLAFNKSIAEELSEKLTDYKNTDVRTTHSLGLSILKKNVDGDIEIDDYKYRGYLKSHILELSEITDKKLTNVQFSDYIDNITELINFARYNLAQTTSDVATLANKYGIPICFDECDVVIKMLEWGKTELNKVDFTDMVWLPVECSMNARAFKKDFIFVDECQDQSLMSIELILKLAKRGSRFIFVGDKNQTINTFSGSSEESFDFMRDYPKTTIFDLPICYRCPSKVVDIAKDFVPDIQCKDGAIDGVVMDGCSISSLKDGDMVLCRTKAPLVKLYTKLLNRNIPCYIKGEEFGTNLKRLLEPIELEALGVDLKRDGVFVRLYDNLFDMRNKLISNNGLDYHDATLSQFIVSQYDMIKALETLSRKCNTKTELVSHIDNMFNENNNGVILTTIHKAKGLEADNVYILCNSSMPLKLAKKQWEKDAERNLMYVAYTRAKKKLGFISEKEIKPFGVSQSPDKIIKELGLIEELVCRVLGKKPTEQQDSVEVARFNLNGGITDINNANTIDSNFTMMNELETNPCNDNLLDELDKLIS